MSPQEQVRLRPARWVRLPGTDREVLLHGKRHSADGAEVRDLPTCR